MGKNKTMKATDATANEKIEKDNDANLKKNNTENARSLKYNSMIEALMEDDQKNASRGVVDGVMTQPKATTTITEGETRTTEVDGTIADSNEAGSKKDSNDFKEAKTKPTEKSNDAEHPDRSEKTTMNNEVEETKAVDSKKTPAKKTNSEDPSADDADSTSMDINEGVKESEKDHSKKSNETVNEDINLEKNQTRLSSSKKNVSTDALNLKKENSNLKKNVTQPANATSTNAEAKKDSTKQENDSKIKLADEHKKNVTLASGSHKTKHVQKIEKAHHSDYETENFEHQNDASKHLPTSDDKDDKRTIGSLKSRKI